MKAFEHTTQMVAAHFEEIPEDKRDFKRKKARVGFLLILCVILNKQTGFFPFGSWVDGGLLIVGGHMIAGDYFTASVKGLVGLSKDVAAIIKTIKSAILNGKDA